MSFSEEANQGENDFKWGNKIGTGVKNRQLVYYNSFTYGGMKYFLYDCVYLYKEDEPEPYIGKLVKMWELPNGERKIKVVWFFRPIELSNWLGDDVPPKNEIFLACGEGRGLSNTNPLEVIVGKCNVICTSTDERNRQPSDKEMKMAEYIFYRTFNVGNCKISDNIDDKIAGIDVWYFFNRKDGRNLSGVPRLGTNVKDDREEMDKSGEASHLLPKLNSDKAQETLAKDNEPGHPACSVLKGGKREPISSGIPRLGTYMKVDREEMDKSGEASHFLSKLNLNKAQKALTRGNEPGCPASSVLKGGKLEPILDERTESKRKLCFDEGVTKSGKVAIIKVECKDGLKSFKRSASSGRFHTPLKKWRFNDDVTKPSEELQHNLSPAFAPGKVKIRFCLKRGSETPGCNSEDKIKATKMRDSIVQDNGHFKKVKPVLDGMLRNDPALVGKDIKTEGSASETIRRPEVDRSKWFKKLAWEDRIWTAHERGTLIALENLDPDYTSGEIEDIILQHLMEKCHVKVIQRTAFSSPFSGQAIAIFETREAAGLVLKMLNRGCLMLPNGRPLVAGIRTPRDPRKPSPFPGHLSIDKLKLRMREEMKQAVSTSHYSQPNSIEYEMAMEWNLLQTRSEMWWKELYEQQGEQLEKLKMQLKSI